MTGPTPGKDVIDILAEAAFQALYGEGTKFRATLPPTGQQREDWQYIAQAVRTAAEPYQNPTPDAYASAVRALEFHRDRAQVAVELAEQLFRMIIIARGEDEELSEDLRKIRRRILRAKDDAVTAVPSTVCPTCTRTSYHPEDIRQRYCAACRKFYDEMEEETMEVTDPRSPR